MNTFDDSCFIKGIFYDKQTKKTKATCQHPPEKGKYQRKKGNRFLDSLGDPGEARTHDPLIKSQLLYQLSYGVLRVFKHGAKVLLFDKSANFFEIFFSKNRFVKKSQASLEMNIHLRIREVHTM